MRHILWTMLTLLLAHSSTLADIQFDKETVKLGEVRSGSPLSHRFTFLNRGNSSITFVNVRTTCGCLRPQLTQHTWAAGEKGQIKLYVHTLGEPAGLQTWRAFLTYRDNGQLKRKTLTLSATIRKEVIVQPAALLIYTTGTAKHRLTLTDTRAKPLSITKLLSDSEHIKARVVKQTKDSKGQTVYDIELSVIGEIPAGQTHHALTIVTNDAGYQQLYVPMTIHKRSAAKVVASPSRVEWTGPKDEALPSKIVLLRSGGTEAVLIDRLLAHHPAITCRWAKGPGKFATVKFTIDASKVKGDKLETAVDIFVSSPSTLQLSVPISCELR